MGAFWLDLGEYRGPKRAHALIGYMVERRRRDGVAKVWRSYVADSLQAAPQGKYVMRRYAELITPHEDIDVDATIERVAALVASQGGES